MATQNNNISNDINFSELDDIIELVEREKWINWKLVKEEVEDGEDKEKKVPVDFSGTPIDATDETNWMKYEQAKKAVQDMNDADGMGFVFSDDDDVMGIDLDDCRDPATGEVDEWAREIIDEVDTFWELSPSRTGFHGYVEAFIDGSDGKADVEGAEGHIEMYSDNRYFTVTGDRISESGEYVKKELKPVNDVFERYYDEDDSDNSDSTNVDVDITVHDVLDGNYPEEERIAHPIDRHGSSTGANFMIDEGGGTWRCWRDEVTGNALHLIGMQAGIISCEQHGNGNISNSDWKDIIEEAQNRGYDIDDPVSTIPDNIYTDIDEWDNKYIKYRENEDGEKYPEEVTTFVMELNAILEDQVSNDTKLDLNVIPSSEKFDEYQKIVEPTVFNDKRKFKKEVCTAPSTTFQGTQGDLDELRKIVVHQESETKKSTQKVGMHGDEFVTPSGSYSIDSDTEYRYEQTGSSIDSKFELEADEIGEYDEEEVKEILELVPQTRKPERLLPVLGWAYASLYTPEIREVEGEISQLAVAGDSEVGKSATLEVIQRLVGLDGIPESAKDSQFAMLKKLSSTTNIPIWIDEYKPSDIQQRKLDSLQDYLRKTTRAGDETRGNADQSVTRYILSSPVILSGEQTIQGSAERRRFMRTQFTHEARQGESKRAFIELTGGSFEDSNGEIEYYDGYDLTEHAKALHHISLSQKHLFDKAWKGAKESVHKKVAEMRIDGISDIEYVGLSMMRLGISTINLLYTRVGGSGLLIEESDLDDAIEYVAKKMGNSRKSHADEFLEVLSTADPPKEGIVHRVDSDRMIRISITDAHHMIKEYLGNKNLENSYDILNKPSDYRKRFQNMVDYDDGYVLDTVNDHELNRCVVIDPDEANEIIDGFQKTNLFG